ncbi:MAG: terminase gpA endonuclease subunit, partial [Rhodospirillaceae bacterium]
CRWESGGHFQVTLSYYGDARHIFFRGFRSGLLPRPRLNVAEWADRYRIVPAGSPNEGPWSNATVPYLVEVMNCLSFDHPARTVVFVGSRQSGKSEPGINLFGYVVDQQPRPMAIFLPSLAEVKKYEQTKLAPTIDATPTLKRKVAPRKSRDTSGSTGELKRFGRSGYCVIGNAGSSKSLQMISVGVLVIEELAEWPADVGGRGHPLDQAIGRLDGWLARGVKVYVATTPGIEGICRGSQLYEASDQRRYYVPCPHCGAFQRLEFLRLMRRADRPPYGTYFECASCVSPIEHLDKPAMLARGCWLKTYPAMDADDEAPGDWLPAAAIERFRRRSSGGREPGFSIWQAYSPFKGWDDITGQFLAIGNDVQRQKDFDTQVLGTAYRAHSEAPDHQVLQVLRQPYPWRQVPAEFPVLTGFVDVQGARWEYGVYAWGEGLSCRLIDRGLIEGTPALLGEWEKLRPIIRRRYRTESGRTIPVDLWGVDSGSGQHTNLVYQFVRNHARVLACKGVAGWRQPALGPASAVDLDLGGRRIRGGASVHGRSRAKFTQPSASAWHWPKSPTSHAGAKCNSPRNATPTSSPS